MKTKTSVLIVGAGPSGLAMALWLKKGIQFRIIDKNVAVSETSRALAIQARTLEFYRQLGIADEVIAAGILEPELIIRRNGRVSAQVRLGDLGKSFSPYPYLLFLSQDIHEKILIKKLEQLNVIVERQTELLHFTQNNFQGEATVRGPLGEENISFSYLCGCDGAQSLVRRLIGIKFSKKTYPQSFFVADVVASGTMAEKGVQIALHPKDFSIVMPIQKSNSVRLTGIIPVESENKDNLSFTNISEYINKSTALQIQKVNWFSPYKINIGVASHFQQGRTFLVGDAAHIHTPFAGQGMNSGIGDAVNLAWKLAAVLKGQMNNKILATYETERIPFAEELLTSVDSIFYLIAGRSFLASILRGYILPILLPLFKRLKSLLGFTFKLLSQTRNNYRESPLSTGLASSLQAGDRLPWLKTETTDNYESLKSMDWQIHIYGNVNAEFASVADFRGFRVNEFIWDEKAEAKGFIKNAFYFLRPDGHIALVDTKQNSSVLKEYLNVWGINHSQNLKSLNATAENTLNDLI